VTFLKLLSCMLLLMALGTGLILSRAFDNEPLVNSETQLTPTDLRRAREFLRYNLQAGHATVVTLTESDFSLLSTYLLGQLNGGGANVTIRDEHLQLQASIGIPDNWFGRYLNLQVELQETDSVPMLSRLEIGSLNIPSSLVDPLLRLSHAEFMQRLPDYATLLSAIHNYEFDEGQVHLEYELQDETLEVLAMRGRELLLTSEFTENLLEYSEKLAELASRHGDRRYVSLAEVLSPMFGHASLRGGNPVEENRAALLALALYQLDIDVPRLLEGELQRPSGRRKVRFTLYGRYDLAQHFLGSAGLAVSTEVELANYVGLLKEVDDSQSGGSGFSFADLAADRTGSRFGELAIANPASARELQRALDEIDDEKFFFDDFRDLPEFLDRGVVNDAYEDEGGSFYLDQLSAIDNRIANTPLYQKFLQ